MATSKRFQVGCGIAAAALLAGAWALTAATDEDPAEVASAPTTPATAPTTSEPPVEDTTTRRFGFNFVSSTLEVNSFQLGQLVKHATNTSDEEGRRLQPEEFNVVPLLAHELSHARDVLDGWTSNEAGGIDAKAQAVIDTELKAWAREALSAVQVWASSGHASEKPPQDDIVEGWLGYQPEMLDAAWSHRKTNGLMSRLIDYVSKNAGASDVETINAWISGRKRGSASASMHGPARSTLPTSRPARNGDGGLRATVPP